MGIVFDEEDTIKPDKIETLDNLKHLPLEVDEDYKIVAEVFHEED